MKVDIACETINNFGEIQSESYPNIMIIGHFTVVRLVTWPWIGSEAGGDLVLIQTSLLFICRSCCSYAN